MTAQPDNAMRKTAQIEVYKSIAERKEIGIAALKGWDQNSRQNLQDMRGLIDGWYQNLNEFLEDSYLRQEKVIKFFSSFKLQSSSDFSFGDSISKFTLGPLKVDPKTKAKIPIDPSQNALADYLRSIEREMTAFQNNLNLFHKTLETTIVQKILIDATREEEKIIKDLLSQKKDIKERIKKLSQATKSSYDELFRHLYLSLGEMNRIRRPGENMFQYVFVFVNNVRKLSISTREFGIVFVELFEAAKRLEKLRLSSQRDAFFEFNAAMERTFAGNALTGVKSSELALRKISPGVWNGDHLKITEIIPQAQTEAIKNKIAASELTVPSLKEYIAKEKIEENIKELFDHFVMRRFLVREADAKSAAQNDVILYMTVDYYYTIFQFNKVTKKHACLADVPIEKATLEFKDQGSVVFKFEESGFLWNSKKKVALIFNGNEREELRMDHENFLGLLTIGKSQEGRKTQNAPVQQPQRPPSIGELKPEQKEQTPVQDDPFNKPSGPFAQNQKDDPEPQNDEVFQAENRALAFSSANIPVPETLQDSHQKAPENDDSEHQKPFGEDTKLETWNTE